MPGLRVVDNFMSLTVTEKQELIKLATLLTGALKTVQSILKKG